MRLSDFFSAPCVKSATLTVALLVLTGFSQPSLALNADEASQEVKLQSCKENMTVDQIIDQSVKAHSQRDIGWRTFQEDGYYDVERAVLINKGLELHYRWRVELNGAIKPENERTEKLCSPSI